MAEDQGGQRKDLFQSAPWLTLFGAFKIALDPKKLLLAGAGILAMALGWWLLAIFFGLFRKEAPQWSAFEDPKEPGKKQEQWKSFKAARQNWNLFHEMAGQAPASLEKARKQDAADLANSLEEYQQLVQLEQALKNYYTQIEVKKNSLTIEKTNYSFEPEKKDALPQQEIINAGQMQLANVKDKKVKLRNVTVILESSNKTKKLQPLPKTPTSATQ